MGKNYQRIHVIPVWNSNIVEDILKISDYLREEVLMYYVCVTNRIVDRRHGAINQETISIVVSRLEPRVGS